MKKFWLLTVLLGAVTFIAVKKAEFPEPTETNENEPILFV
jgi:hypothetical protein